MSAGADEALWYLMRGTGVVSLLLLTAVMALGIATHGRVPLGALPRFATRLLHRNLSLMALAFIAVHVVSAVVDPYVSIRLTDAVLPFTAGSEPLMAGLGALAFDLCLAVIATSIWRRHVGPRTWRAVHLGAYAMWPLAFIHAAGIGSDASAPWAQALGVLTVAVIGGSIAWRLVPPERPREGAAGP